MSIQEVLIEYIPEYYAGLADHCKTCKFLLSEKECDCCKNYDMYESNKESNENNKMKGR